MSGHDDFADGFDDDESMGRVDRGCGRRVKGGVYAEVPLGEGEPLAHFFVDPPIKLMHPERLGITPRGVSLIQDAKSGVWNVVDWIGEKHYPNVADFVEEVSRFGASRRLPKNLDFAKLGPRSRLILIHPRAYIENFVDLDIALADAAVGICPKAVADHENLDVEPAMCVGLYNYVITGGDHQQGNLSVRRSMPAFQYWSRPAPAGFVQRNSPAIFWSLPLSRIAVIEGEGADEAQQAASRAGVEVRRWSE